MIEFGYTGIEYQYFPANRDWMDVINEPAWNVICTKIGTELPDKWIVIGGHYDSYTSNNLNYPAPGADDNASGTAAMLELARIFKDIDFRKSLMFVAFGAEEQGLDGSDFLAEEMMNDSIDIELMMNFDVISYEEDDVPDFRLSATQDWTYGQVYLDATARLTDLIPHTTSSPISSDDRSYADRGYHTVTPHEYYFHPNMHTPLDISTAMDFGYMAKMIRTAAATIPIIDRSADPIICTLYDIGDGQSLRVSWEDDCYPDFTYQVIYGLTESALTDTVDITAAECYFDLTGLTESQNCYVSVNGVPSDGYPPLYLEVSVEKPLSIPRQPSGLAAEPALESISLSWNDNIELDLDHYKLLRKIPGGEWSTLESMLSIADYVDYSVVSGQEYLYAVLAVDNEDNESDTSLVAHSVPAFFDKGVLIVDEFQIGGYNPTEPVQTIYFADIMGDIEYDRVRIDSSDEAISRAEVGQYNPVFWIDDDDLSHVMSGSLDTLAWFFEFDTDFLLSGWSTIYAITGQTYFYPGDFFHDQLGISSIAQNPLSDFTGATGVDGWPDLEIRLDAPGGGRMPDIDIFGLAPNAEVICTFNSASGNQFYGNKPVGFAYDTHQGKRVILGFPLYWLTETSAQALIIKAMEYFAEESFLYGDANGDWGLNILDITYLINYLYKDGPSPIDINNGDPNASCTVNILDVTYLINYLYKDGSGPMEGCVI